ncbi:hypothetical protein OC835_002146, partial [Tilletia horrida]
SAPLGTSASLKAGLSGASGSVKTPIASGNLGLKLPRDPLSLSASLKSAPLGTSAGLKAGLTGGSGSVKTPLGSGSVGLKLP